MTLPEPKPHVLYVAWGFPPSRGGGVYRALATANGLADAGFDVTVLTCEREVFELYTGADPSLEAEVRPGIDVVRLPFEWPAKVTDIRRWPAERARNPAAWFTRWLVEERRDFPEPRYGHWAASLAATAREIHARRPVDLVIGTANPNVDLVPALTLHREFGVPFVYDHRDAWTLDVYTEDEANTDDPRVAATEAELVESALEVWFVNEPISAWHRTRYAEHAHKIYTVPNGYDEAFAPRTDSPDAEPGSEADAEGLRFGYIGTMTPYMPMEEFGQAWQSARAAGGPLATARAEFWGYLGFFGTPDPGLVEHFEASSGHGIDYLGPVPKASIAATYARFDALLLVVASGKFVTSGKVYEYMSSGLPIVSVHDPSIDTSRVLTGYPAWFPAASLDPADIADALEAAARAVADGTLASRDECRAFAQTYERNRILAPRLEGLFSLTSSVDSEG